MSRLSPILSCQIPYTMPATIEDKTRKAPRDSLPGTQIRVHLPPRYLAWHEQVFSRHVPLARMMRLGVLWLLSTALVPSSCFIRIRRSCRAHAMGLTEAVEHGALVTRNYNGKLMMTGERARPVGHSRSMPEEETVDKCDGRRGVTLPQGPLST